MEERLVRQDRGQDDSESPYFVATRVRLSESMAQIITKFEYMDSIVLLIFFSVLWYMTSKEFFGVSRVWEESIALYILPCALLLVWLGYLCGLRSIHSTILSTACIVLFFFAMMLTFMIQSGA